MISTKNFVTLKVANSDLMEAIDYACRSFYFTYDRMNYGQRLFSRLIRIVVGIAIEKTFEQYLKEMQIPFGTAGRTHWRLKDKTEFIIKYLKLDIKGYHIYPTPGRHFPDWFVDVEGLVTKDQLEKPESPDIYLQAFLVSPQYNNSNTHRYITLFPASWVNRWREPRNVIVTGSIENSIILHGESDLALSQPIFHNFDSIEIIDANGDSINSTKRFCSLEYIGADQRPNKPMAIQIANNGSNSFTPNDWIDLWLHEPEVTFTGWGTKQDYKLGKIIPPSVPTKIYTGGTRTFNYSRLINRLRPLKELIDA